MYTEQVLWQIVGMMSNENSPKYAFIEKVSEVNRIHN